MITKLSVRILLLIVSVSFAHGQICRQLVFRGTMEGGKEWKQSLRSDIAVRLTPLDDHWGWTLSVNPKGSTDDWSYPVNFPIRTAESQLIGTGYGRTAEERLSGPSVVHFLLNQADYIRYSQMADEALSSTDGNAATAFIEKVRKAHTGTIVFVPLKYENEGSPDAIRWVRFTATVTVPKYFHTDGQGWHPHSCPNSR